MSKRILVVEDVEEMREMMRHLLEGIPGLTVVLAANGAEARIELSRNAPDFVLLDEVLPGESSLDLLKELIQNQIPTLLMTGMEDPSHDLPAGTLGRIAKPDWDGFDKSRKEIQNYLKDG